MYASRRHVVVKSKLVPLRLSFIDIKKTDLNGMTTRDLFVLHDIAAWI